MKKKRLFAAFSLILLITCIMTSCTFGVKSVSPSEARNSVVTVVRADGYAQGSGFAIGKVGEPVEYIVTNDHVVKGEWGNTVATVYFSLAADQKMLANIYYYDEEKDIAVLKLPEATTLRTALELCPMKYVDPDDTFAALGYPGDQVTDWPKYSPDDITITKGGIKKTDRVNGQDVYMLDLAVTNGNSGGPLINSDGQVVGINTYGINHDNYAIAIDELIGAVDTEKVPLSVYNGNLWLYLIIGATLLVAILLIIIIILAVTKKKVVPVDPPLTLHTKPQTTPQKPVKLIGVGGVLNGKRYNVTGTAKIGRDPAKCQIVFPVNTKGVSGLHCEISFDGSVCYVKDLNSSYGTFTMDGKKIAPGTPKILKSGDKFYLASPANVFEINY